MRPHRGGRPPSSPPQTVKQMLKVLRQQRSGGGRPPGLAAAAPPPLAGAAGPSSSAPWPGPPPLPPTSCGAPPVPHLGPGGAYGGGPPSLGGCQAPFAPPEPTWSQPMAAPEGDEGGAVAGLSLDLELDPEPDPGELAAARAAIRAMDPRELLRQDEEGDTLLHILCARGLRVPARAVAEAFAQWGQLELREHRGKTPLLVAAAAAAPGVVRDLLGLGADPNGTDRAGRNVLHLAAELGLPRVLQAVMSSGVPVTWNPGISKATPPCTALSYPIMPRCGGGGSPPPPPTSDFAASRSCWTWGRIGGARTCAAVGPSCTWPWGVGT
ncbi:NF-kappa-B inhibitor delta isoform X2 [Columba livia]|uniref:NF-kappa-B inhibitor delta isoform X2 n=1 Tax=Columba livia TaxID=8932 RepID=UPI0031BB7B9D